MHRAGYLGLMDRPDYETWICKTSEFQGLPNERARDLLLNESPSTLHGVIHTLLDNVTDVAHTPTTRLFAENILGSKLFSLHYGLPSVLNTSSLLQELDEPLIDSQSRAIILAHRACVFTARPSLPPGYQWMHSKNSLDADGTYLRTNRADGPAASVPVHPPEAEIGLQLLGLENLPMIALGQMQWLADQYRERVYDLTKPSPVQALAAMLLAAGIAEQDALHSAYDCYRKIGNPSEVEALDGEDVIVLEDNAAGLHACHLAKEMAGRSGIRLTVHGIGISSSPIKQAALKPYCERLYCDVNKALHDISPGL